MFYLGTAADLQYRAQRCWSGCSADCFEDKRCFVERRSSRRQGRDQLVGVDNVIRCTGTVEKSIFRTDQFVSISVPVGVRRRRSRKNAGSTNSTSVARDRDSHQSSQSIRCWPGDGGGHFVGAGCDHTQDLVEGEIASSAIEQNSAFGWISVVQLDGVRLRC